MWHQPPGTGVLYHILVLSYEGTLQVYQSRRLAVGRDPRGEARFQALYLRTFLSMTLS